jgi:ethanolamine utilization protein EutP (predicted NTPase)
MTKFKRNLIVCLTVIATAFTSATFAQKTSKQVAGAYLEITLKVNEADRAAAAGVYLKYKQPFLKQVTGAVSKELLIRTDDVQVLHGFKTQADAEAYLKTDLFNNDVVTALKPYLQASPEVRIYTIFTNK